MRNDKTAVKNDPELPAMNNPGAIDQVRELLFGESKRSHEARLDDIDRKIEMLRDDLAARYASLEARLAEQGRDTDRKHTDTIDNIGQAIADLGASIRTLAAGGKR